MTEKCSIHDKMRTVVNLEECGGGQFRCKSINPCKIQAGPDQRTGGGGAGGHQWRSSAELAAAGHVIIHPDGPEVCYAHGKTRNAAQLCQVATLAGPQWECLPEARCKVRSEETPEGAMLLNQLSMAQRFNPYANLGISNEALLGLIGGRGGGGGGGGGRTAGSGFSGGMGRVAGGRTAGGNPGQTMVCPIHNKRRSMSSLQCLPDGRWVCLPTDVCKMPKPIDPSTVSQCSVHGKTRRNEYLISDNRGGLMCAEENRCQ